MHSLNKKAYPFTIGLSALAGFIDAIGFIYLGGYFISFMSGNSTKLAVSLVNTETSSAAGLVAILILFVFGTMLGVWARHFSKAVSVGMTVLILVTALLTGAALSYEMGWVFAAIALMILAMGAENAVFQRNGEVFIGLTYMTGTLVKLGQRLAGATLGGDKLAWVPYFLLWLGLISGGMAGALLFHMLGLHSLWIGAAWAGGLTVLARIIPDSIP